MGDFDNYGDYEEFDDYEEAYDLYDEEGDYDLNDYDNDYYEYAAVAQLIHDEGDVDAAEESDEIQEDDISEQFADEWFDQQDSKSWTVLDAVENEFGEEWADDALWDEINPHIETLSGHWMKRKCMNIFGRKLCLCQFLNWIQYGETKHQCGRKEVMKTKVREKLKKSKAHKKH